MAVSTADGLTYINDLTKGEWVRYSIRVERAGRYDVICTMAAAADGTKFHLCVNGYNRSGEVKLGGGEEWQTVVLRGVALQAGEQYLDFRVDGGRLHFDRMEIGPERAE